MKPLFIALIISLLIFMLASAAHAQSIYIPPPTACWFTLPNITGGYYVVYNYGNQSYTVYVLTTNEYSTWVSGQGVNATMEFSLNPLSLYALTLPSGNYDLVVYPAPCNTSVPIEYYYYGYGYPVGVVSLGPVGTGEVMGFFNITSISAYNPVGESQFGVPNSGASLQLNAYLVVNLGNGTEQYYLLQNTVGFRTNEYLLSIWDSVWNYTGTYSTLSSIQGSNGVILPSTEGLYYIGNGYHEYNSYVTPISGYLLIKLVSISPLVIRFCYSIIQEGTTYFPLKFECYDTVTIYPSSPVINASIEAMPGVVNGKGSPLDTELVFTGYANSEYTTYSQLNAELALLYHSNSGWALYSNLYSVGVSSAESTTDLTSSVSPSGYIEVNTGPLPQGIPYLSKCIIAPQIPGVTIYVPRYPVDIVSIVPIYIMFYGGLASGREFREYIPEGGNVTIYIDRYYYLNNGTRLVYLGSNETLTICAPTDLSITTNDFVRQYLTNISSVFPISINGTITANLIGWFNEDTVLVISIPQYEYFNNSTRLSYLGNTSSIITINKPITMNITLNDYVRQYTITVNSPVPISLLINGQSISNITNFSGWVNQSSVVTIYIPTYYYLNNGTRLIYLGGGYIITVVKPLILSINNFTKQYLVTVSSPYPININGITTTNYTAWMSPGTTLTIPPSITFVYGVFMKEPGYVLTINKPVNLSIHWEVDWEMTKTLYGGIMALLIVIITVIFIAKRIKALRLTIHQA